MTPCHRYCPPHITTASTTISCGARKETRERNEASTMSRTLWKMSRMTSVRGALLFRAVLSASNRKDRQTSHSPRVQRKPVREGYGPPPWQSVLGACACSSARPTSRTLGKSTHNRISFSCSSSIVSPSCRVGTWSNSGYRSASSHNDLTPGHCCTARSWRRAAACGSPVKSSRRMYKRQTAGQLPHADVCTANSSRLRVRRIAALLPGRVSSNAWLAQHLVLPP
eukprot:scaffold40046_cov29-Tisochrysis_lutea.AAC.1